MRTNRLIYILGLLLLTAFSSCVKEQQDSSREPEGIVLKLVVSDPLTKATRDGVEALNENVVASKVDIFFYDEETLEITKEALQATISGTLVQLPTNPNEIETIFGTLGSGATCGLFVVANFTGTYQGSAGSRTITQVKNSLLPAPNWNSLPQTSFVMTGYKQAKLLNAQGATPIYETVNLERVAAKISFDMTVASAAVEQEESRSWEPQTSGMSVYLVYAMRKATLDAEPVMMPASANVTYQVGGGSQNMVDSQSTEFVLYDTGTTRARTRGGSTVQCEVYSTDYTHEVNGETVTERRPFYTYPMAWETGSAMEPYLKLIIPWKYGNVTRKYYYKIPFHGDALVRNHWYHISIDVQILGTEQADPPQVDIYYSIADWEGTMDTASAQDITSVTSVPATVITARFLSVPTTEYVMYNSDQLIIPIQSSHDVEVVGFDVASGAYTSSHDIEANYVGENPHIYNPFSTTLNSSGQIVAAHPDYSEVTPSAVSHAFTYDQAADAQGWSVVVNGRESVTLTHAINRDMSSDDYDVAPYTIRMRFRHEGEGASLYFTDVTVEQRPSIIIKPEANSGGTSNCGYAYVNTAQNNGNNWTRSGSNWSGYTYSCTDGTWTGSSYVTYGSGWNSTTVYANDEWDYYLGSSPSDLSNSSNKNTNMYVIETSVLPTSGAVASYMLGDPRSRTIDNLGQSWCQSAAAVVGNNRRISYYYPAGGAEYNYFIAPKFRIASSFGSTHPMTFDNAKRRCSSYQEDGYPAGRWRLPTVAEITYMAQLTKDGLIPRLLGGDDSDDTDYWSNNGYVTVPGGSSSSSLSSSTGTSGDKYVRCVYDEWYWENTVNEKVTKTTFTWGDQSRDDVRKN